jgi:hypothetical protein
VKQQKNLVKQQKELAKKIAKGVLDLVAGKPKAARPPRRRPEFKRRKTG